MKIRDIGADSAAEALSFAGRLADEFGQVTNPSLVARAPELAAELGDEIRHACCPPEPNEGLFVLRGLPVRDETIGATPPSWSAADDRRTAEWDILFLLLAAVMGRPFGWERQQHGRLVHDIVPSRGCEQEQTGASSSVLLSPHTEDAFHPRRAHLLMLGCMRNHEKIPTTAAFLRDTAIDDADYAVLSTPTVPILPDDSYGDDHSAAGPAPIPTLWRMADRLCLRYDPAYTPMEQASDSYRAAYARLGAELGRVSCAVSLSPGEVLVVDNDAVVHGRVPFIARYDGTDRWLKRINVRLPGRARPTGERAEHGYGQQVVDPCA